MPPGPANLYMDICFLESGIFAFAVYSFTLRYRARTCPVRLGCIIIITYLYIPSLSSPPLFCIAMLLSFLAPRVTALLEDGDEGVGSLHPESVLDIFGLGFIGM